MKEEIERDNISQDNDNSSSLIKTIRNWVSKKLKNPNESSLEETVNELIEEHDTEGRVLGIEEKLMLSNILNFGTTKVEDIMVPRTDIIAVPYDAGMEEFKGIILEHEHTRMPVYKESLDHIIGFLHIKDLFPILCRNEDLNIQKIMRQIIFVPTAMSVMDLLVKMRQSRVHIAVVVDEYGGTDGLLTIEDLVEEIVGDIEDEHDELSEKHVTYIDENKFEVSARISLEELEELLNVVIDEELKSDIDTLGGLLYAIAGHVPVKGEIIEFNGNIKFEILDADPRKIKKVMIVKE